MGAAWSAMQLAVAGITPSMQTWRLKIPGVAWLLGFTMVSSVARKLLIPGPLSSVCHVAFDIGACTGSVCFNSQPSLGVTGEGGDWRGQTVASPSSSFGAGRPTGESGSRRSG